MDDEQPQTGMSGSLTVVRAAVVLALFVAAVAILVAVGTRPSVSGVPSTAPTTTPTTVAAGGSTTTTAAGATTTTAAATTTTAHHGRRGPDHDDHHGARSTVSVVVANGTSTNGLAAHYTTVIGAGGWAMKTPIDAATSVPTSAVYYAPGFQPEATAIATTIGVKSTEVLPISAATPVSATSGYDVIVVIGQDLATTTDHLTLPARARPRRSSPRRSGAWRPRRRTARCSSTSTARSPPSSRTRRAPGPSRASLRCWPTSPARSRWSPWCRAGPPRSWPPCWASRPG